MKKTLSERFWAKVDKFGPDAFINDIYAGLCWQWTGSLNPQGYGKIRVGGIDGKNVNQYAHILAYQFCVGEIPPGLTIDHLCRNRACVNPAHLEAVSLKTNILRGTSPSAIHARKTHCPKGHEYSGENLIPPSASAKGRNCRECTRIRNRKRKAAQRQNLRLTSQSIPQ